MSIMSNEVLSETSEGDQYGVSDSSSWEADDKTWQTFVVESAIDIPSSYDDQNDSKQSELHNPLWVVGGMDEERFS